MKITFLIIAALAGGATRIDAAYPMSSIIECEEIVSRPAVVESYPDHMLFCWEGAGAPMLPTMQSVKKEMPAKQFQ